MNPLRRTRSRLDDDRGAVVVIVAFAMVILMGVTALALDLARLRHERHIIQAAVDLGSLAGAGFLPVSNPSDAADAESAVRMIAEANAPQLSGGGLSITFGCVVEAPPAASGNSCGTGGPGGWTIRDDKALHACNPYGGDLCNAILVQASSTISYWFAPFIGFDTGNTGSVNAAACRGNCGQVSTPLDIALLIDRTGSMSPSDIQNLKNAILDPSPAEDSLLEYYDPAQVHIGLLALPYKVSNNQCAVSQTQTYQYQAPAADLPRWQVVGLSDDYRQASGAIDHSSNLVQAIQCLHRATNTNVTVNGHSDSHGHTNHGEPMIQAQALLSQGRPEAPDIIIFFADGESNQPYGFNPCTYAVNTSAAAKAAGTSVYSLAYGATGARCQYDNGSWGNAWATTFLSTVASPTTTGPSTDDVPGGCGPDENTDGDYYFCESRGADLSDTFRQIAYQTNQKPRLLNF
ncbi:MAG: VWA domain-containing protein [Actinomycetota bacterium]